MVPAFLAAALAALLGIVACQGRTVPPPPPPPVGPPAIPDAQPAVDAPLFLGQNAFPAPLAAQSDYAPTLATVRADGGNSGVADGPAPLGRAPVTGSALISLLPPLLWDRSGDLTAGCSVAVDPGVSKACLAAVDDSTLTIQSRWLPPGQDLNLATAVMDDAQEVLVTTRQGHLFVVDRPAGAASSFRVVRDIDLSGRLGADQGLLGAVADGSGNLWFSTGGPSPSGTLGPDTIVGYVTPADQVDTTVVVAQRAETGFAVDQDNVYLATAPSAASDQTGEVYDLTAASGQVQTVWREPYDAGSRVGPRAVTRGTASPVMLLGSQYVAITDDADDQAHLRVFLRGTLPAGPNRTTTTGGATATTSGATTTTTTTSTTATTSSAPTTTIPAPATAAPDARQVCTVGLFSPGASAVTSAPIAYSSGSVASVVVANGFNAPPSLAAPGDGGPANDIDQMATGVTRVDVAADGSGCRTMWTTALRLKTGPVLASTTGLIYGYTQDEGRAAAGTYVWYFVAVDYQTGRIVWRQRVGAGSTKNDNRQPLTLGANGVLYQSLPLGLVWMHDVAQKP